MVPKVFSKLANVARRQEYIQCYLFQDCLQPALNSVKINKHEFMPMLEVTQNKHSSDVNLISYISVNVNLVSYITHDIYTADSFYNN